MALRLVVLLLGALFGACAASSSRAAAPPTVKYSFTGNEISYFAKGSGTVTLTSVPDAASKVAAKRVTGSPITLKVRVRGGDTYKTVEFHVTGAIYAYSQEGQKTLHHVLTLNLRVDRSTLAACPVGSTGYATISHSERYTTSDKINVRAVGGCDDYTLENDLQKDHVRRATVSIVLTPRPALLPSRIELKVNGTTAIATVGTHSGPDSSHVDAPSVAPRAPLEIDVSVDEPLPPGWKLTIRHNGDPNSKGNGDYWVVCEIDGQAGYTNTTCGDTRPALASPGDDFVAAALVTPTGLYLGAQVHIPVH